MNNLMDGKGSTILAYHNNTKRDLHDTTRLVRIQNFSLRNKTSCLGGVQIKGSNFAASMLSYTSCTMRACSTSFLNQVQAH